METCRRAVLIILRMGPIVSTSEADKAQQKQAFRACPPLQVTSVPYRGVGC